MADIVKNAADAVAHPRIVEFVTLYDGARGDGDFTFPMMREPEFMKFWDSMMIARLNEAGDDFLYVLYGTKLVASYGADVTGTTIRGGAHIDAAEAFFAYFLDALRERKPLYLSGTIDWKDRDHIKWCQVILPMKRGDAVNEIVSLLCFD